MKSFYFNVVLMFWILVNDDSYLNHSDVNEINFG